MGTPAALTKQTGLPIWLRRLIFALLIIGTTGSIYAINFLRYDGQIFWFKVIILGCHVLLVPWQVITLWNMLLGMIITHFGKPDSSIYPYFDEKGPLPTRLETRTALTMFLRNEDPGPVFERIHAMHESLYETGLAQHFRFVLLSDTDEPEVACQEAKCFAEKKESTSFGMAVTTLYRRREKNIGFKAGNVHDYITHHSEGDDFFVPLDSDSIMSGELLVRMVSSMERHPKIGLLQTLGNGIPAISLFTRWFTIDQRLMVYSYNMGNSWWSDRDSLYWGHNAIIRTEAFRKHCTLPCLPGKPPLGGYILSHDLIEAMFLRRGGYEVRIIPTDIGGSYETQPPTFFEFLKRECRWCQGTMQYWFLLREPGLNWMTIFQVWQTLFTYFIHALWVVLFSTSVVRQLIGDVDKGTMTSHFPELFLMGSKLLVSTLDIMSTVNRHGGGRSYTASAILRVLMSALLAPMLSISITIFFLGLLRGKCIKWDGQNRDRLGLKWLATLRMLWPQTLYGLGVAGLFAYQNIVPPFWVYPGLAGNIVSVPFAVLSASPSIGKIATRLQLCMIPEEIEVPAVLRSLLPPEILAAARSGDLAQKKQK